MGTADSGANFAVGLCPSFYITHTHSIQIIDKQMLYFDSYCLWAQFV